MKAPNVPALAVAGALGIAAAVGAVALFGGALVGADGHPPTPDPARFDGELRLVDGSVANYYPTIDALTNAADTVIVGRVERVAETGGGPRVSEFDPGPPPFTDFQVNVEQVLKGQPGATVTIHQFGGDFEGERWEMSEDPMLVVGEQYLLFLRWSADNGLASVEPVDTSRYFVVGGAQGRFVVSDGRVYSLSAVYPDRRIEDVHTDGAALASVAAAVAQP